MVIAVVGAGGKTSYIHSAAETYLREGKKVLVTTTTHMYAEKDTVITDDPAVITDELSRKSYCMAGVKGPEGKIVPLSGETYEAVCKAADIVLVEADGSKQLPLKYPAEWEPVIPDNTDKIIIIMGLHGIGKKCSESVHRCELACTNIGITPDTVIEPYHIREIIRKGYLKPLRKRYPGTDIEIIPAQQTDLYTKIVAEFIREDRDVSIIKKEWFDPCGELVICGAGHVAGYVSKLAAMIGFRVTVIDDREEFVTKESFPDAERRIVCSFNDMEPYLPDSDNAFYVVLTRGHAWDRECVEKILQRPYAYLGMIGSHKKVEITFNRLREKGYTKEQTDSIHAPVGLSIGARTPAEIAVSICAQIIQVKNKRTVSTMSEKLASLKESGVMCIITEKKGASPRDVGSMMFVTKAGEAIGTIGGGIMEKIAIDEALEVTSVCEKEYRLSNDGGEGIGMICGGTNRVVFVPIG